MADTTAVTDTTTTPADDATQKGKLIEDPKKLQTILADKNAKLEHLRVKAEQQEAELAKYRSQEAERQAAIDAEKQAAEQAKLTEQGKFQEALARNNQTWEQKHNKELTDIRTNAEKQIVPGVIRGALANTPILPSAIADTTKLIQSMIGVNPVTFDTFVKGPDGRPLLDDKMQPVSVEAFVSTYIESRPWIKQDRLAVGTGTSAGGKGALTAAQFTAENALADAKVLEAWEKADPVGCKAAIAAHQRNFIRGLQKRR
ncbi:MAG TPA: hypothetical protein VGP72_32080 [Planctomycetota bacterium]|jgi:hypothetical protein